MGQEQWGQEGQMTGDEGDDRVQEGQILTVTGGGWARGRKEGGRGQEFKMGAVRGQIWG